MKADWKPTSQAPSNLERCVVWVADTDARSKKPIGIRFGQIIEGQILPDGMNGDWNVSHWDHMPDGPST